MALIKCIECNNDVSEFADFCPHCGCPIFMSIKNAEQSKKIDNIKYSIRLSRCEANQVKIIKKIREITGLGLADAKKIVDELSFIKVDCSIDEANNIKKVMESEGSTVEIVSYDPLQEKNSPQQQKIPKCPTCGSTNIRKISGTKKTVSIIGFGILSNNIGKTFECLNCKYKW